MSSTGQNQACITSNLAGANDLRRYYLSFRKLIRYCWLFINTSIQCELFQSLIFQYISFPVSQYLHCRYCGRSTQNIIIIKITRLILLPIEQFTDPLVVVEMSTKLVFIGIIQFRVIHWLNRIIIWTTVRIREDFCGL